jgi:hypothetical protein
MQRICKSSLASIVLTLAGCAATAPQTAQTDPNSAPPKNLDKRAFSAGMKPVMPKVAACYERYRVPGAATLTITIANTGRVSRVQVDGPLGGTPTAACVGGAVMEAQFRTFTDEQQVITPFPVILK